MKPKKTWFRDNYQRENTKQKENWRETKNQKLFFCVWLLLFQVELNEPFFDGG
jgi:hypothetical protein